MALYDETELDNADNIIEQAVAINNLTHGILTVIVLGLCYWILFVALKQVDTRSSAVATAFIMLVLGLFLLGMQLSNVYIFGVQVALFVFALIYTMWRND